MKALIIIGIVIFSVITTFSFILKLVDGKKQIPTIICGMIVAALSIVLYTVDF
jgi:hypothetical protein